MVLWPFPAFTITRTSLDLVKGFLILPIDVNRFPLILYAATSATLLSFFGISSPSRMRSREA